MANETKHEHTRAGAKKAHVEQHCTIEGCKSAYRAKGYCGPHYRDWRHGLFGAARYKICSKPECKKRRHVGGLCETHHNELLAARKGGAKPA